MDRYDYNRESRRLVVRMPTGVHELFVDRVEDAIRSRLKEIRNGSDRAAIFAQKVRPARGTEISFPGGDNTKSKYEPDASFWHDDAQYPGVIIEVAYSQKRKGLDRLAENYLLDSDASIQVVVGLDIEYGKEGSRKATLSVWRTSIAQTVSGNELIVAQEIADEAWTTQDKVILPSTDILYRRSATIMAILRNTQACDFNSETLPMRNLPRMKSEKRCESWLFLRNSFVSILLQQKTRYDS